MSQDRLFHKRLGHSEKVNHLTDFEYIVWGCYILSADDYGVMRLSALTLQADHDRLAVKSIGAIERALHRAVTSGLVEEFEHQGRRYLCQLDWNDFQKIRYPGRSHNPIPPAPILERCSVETRRLFRKHTAAVQDEPEFARIHGNVSEVFPQNRANVSETLPESRANVSGISPKSLRETVNTQRGLPHANANANANGNANGNADEARQKLDPIDRRAGDFVERYVELYAQYRNGAKWFRRKPALEWEAARRLVATWDDARLEKLVGVFLKADEEWIASTDRGLLIFEAKASWCDDRLRQWEAKQARA